MGVLILETIRGEGLGKEATAMTELLEYSYIASFWDEFHDWKQSKYLFKWRNGHKIIKKMWDGYKAPKGIDEDNILLSHIRWSFPKDEEARSARPMGDFRDMMDKGMTHEDMYNELVNKLVRPRYNRKGNRSSYMKELWPHANQLFTYYFGEDWNGEKVHDDWDRDLFIKSMCLMMFSSTIGIVMEERAHTELEAWLQDQPKVAKRFRYEPAENELESKDVDGVFIDNKTGEVAVYVSIKSMGAFTEEFITKQYRNKGKKLPDIYAGYPGQQTEEIEFIQFEGKSLRDLLKESIEK